MSLIQATAIPVGSTGDFTIDQSLRFNDGDSPYLNRTFGSSPTSLKIWTLSFWIKRCTSGATQYIMSYDSGGNQMGIIGYNSSDQFLFYDRDAGSGSADIELYTNSSTNVKRDPSAWSHYLIRADTTEGTGANRVKIYQDGVQITDWSTENYPAQNYDCELIKNHNVNISGWGDSTPDNSFIDGYLAEMYFIDGTALLPTSFGEFGEDYGEWKAKKPSGLTYGTNGFYLPFSVEASVEEDRSGNGNNFNSVNIAISDVVLDTPTNNFATINPLSFYWPYPLTMSEGNLESYYGAAFSAGFATSFVSSGKWYVECLVTRKASPFIGVWDEEFGFDSGDQQNSTHKVCYISDGRKCIGTTFSSYGATYAVGDIIAIKLDQDNHTITFYKNNSSQGEISLSGTVVGTLDLIIGGAGRNDTMIWNFGQDSSFAGEKTAQSNQDSNDIGDFYYTPPTNFLALCTSNMSDPDIKPKEYFDAVQYSGSSSTVTVNDVGFQPDFGWFKKNSGSESSALVNSSSGVGTRVCSNTNEAPESGGITSFDSDGFTCSGGSGRFTENGFTYSAWFWRCNAGTTSSNTSGDITSTVQVNTAAGFSILTYTGVGGDNKTVGHGLSKAPQFIMIKKTNGTGNWVVWHHRLADNYAFEGISSNAAVSGGNPSKYVDSVTSTLVELGDAGENNQDNDTYLMWCWHEWEGYSKFGLYTGNGNVNGTFVYCGFKPRMVWIKGVFGEHGTMHDTVLNPNNVSKYDLLPGYAGAKESGTSEYIDILSNGFKIRTSDYRHNKDGGDYIFMAWADEPFKYATSR